MPALEVSVDGVTIATVSTEGFEVMSVDIGGALIDDDPATLNVSGGSYPENGSPLSLWWVSELSLHPGQRVNVSFLEHGTSSHPGQTIEELFPNEPAATQSDFTPSPDLFKQLRAKPKVRNSLSFRLVSSSGASFFGTTTPEDHGFGFTVLWNWLNPERARLSLHSYSLESLEAQGPMNNHVEEKIHFGDSVEFELVP